MTTETTRKISSHCDRYGDKLVELMEREGAINTSEVPEDAALRYLKELEGLHHAQVSEDHCG